MIYLILGKDSREALKKISEIKNSFLKKGGSEAFIEAAEGEGADLEGINSALNQGSMLPGKRLTIFKNILTEGPPGALAVLEGAAAFLRDCPDVFFFWEKELDKKSDAYLFFKKYSEKIQEFKIPLKNAQKNSEDVGGKVFYFVDRMVSNASAERWPAFKKAVYEGIEPGRLIYALLWKLKREKLADSYFNAVLAESEIRKNPKNAEEIMEKLILRAGKGGI